MFHYIYLTLLVFSIQNLGVNSEIYNIFPEVKSYFNSTKVSFFKIVSKLNTTVSSFQTLYLSSSRNAKFLVSAIDEFVSNIYKNVNLYDVITYLKIDDSLWKGSVEYREYPCSKFNVTAFDSWISNELFGQHLVSWSLAKQLEDHLNTVKPKKPLILSFHGPVGCGKTFVSKIIVDSLFQTGINSKFAHIYHGSIDFPHEKNKEIYRKKLLNDMIVLSHLCDRSVFIFDEVDSMVPGVIDVLIPYMHVYENNTINSMKNIYLFLSNSGSNKIEEIVHDAWLKGISRENLNAEDFSSLKEAAYNEPGGLQHSEIVKSFIDAFIPFLPLEKEHVKQCIVTELALQNKSITDDIVEKIANQMVYYPSDFELFSVSGCKKVAQKVYLYGDSD